MFLPANIFQPLIDVFESVIQFFHNSVGVPWGWSIVLLTVAVRLLLVPLMLKQFHSMQSMQRHMPEMKAIQTKYKDDKQRQQQELMKFYSENKINPFASCIPLVAQIPVLISLFYMLRTSLRQDICPGVQKAFRTAYAMKHHVAVKSVAVKALTTPCYVHGNSHGASFLFLRDLTNQATGIPLIVMLVLYVGTQMGAQLIMSAPTMDQTQRRIMLFLPLIFVAFVFRFPAGVLVYWVTANSWMLGQQFVFKQRIARMRPPTTADGTVVAGKAVGSTAATGKAAGIADPEPTSGLGGLLRGRKASPAPEAVPSGRAVPPPPPRKKKKRSGRRR